jgi:hypothetical protein
MGHKDHLPRRYAFLTRLHSELGFGSETAIEVLVVLQPKKRPKNSHLGLTAELPPTVVPAPAPRSWTGWMTTPGTCCA